MKSNKLLISVLALLSICACGDTTTSQVETPSTSSQLTTVAPTSTTQTPTTAKPTTATPTTQTPTTVAPTTQVQTNPEIVAVSTKVYNIGDAIDKAAFKVELVNKDGTKTSTSNFTVTLSEEKASVTSKATITANEKTTTVAIPLTKVTIEAEDCKNTTDNYRFFAKDGTYKTEAGYGENKTASFGLNSKTRKTSTNTGVNTEMGFTIESGCAQTVDLYMNAASTICRKDKTMGDVLVEDALDMTVNGVATSFIEDAKVLGENTKDWFNWKYLKIATINLKEGTNTIEMIVNYQGELVSNPQNSGDGPFNVDYFVFEYVE